MNRLKLARFKSELSQWGLANISGVPRWAIQLIEAGNRNPTPRERAAIAAALNLREDQLFGKIKAPPQNP